MTKSVFADPVRKQKLERLLISLADRYGLGVIRFTLQNWRALDDLEAACGAENHAEVLRLLDELDSFGFLQRDRDYSPAFVGRISEFAWTNLLKRPLPVDEFR